MQNVAKILLYLNGYWRYALLNILFNLFSSVFSLLSIGMLFPFLQILFLDDVSRLEGVVAKGAPVLNFSADAIIDYLNFILAETILEHDKLFALTWVCLFVVIGIFLKNLTRYLAVYFLAPVRNGIVRDLRNKIFKKTLELPLSFYSEERKGDIMSRMTADVKEVEWSVLNSIEMLFRDPVNIIIFLVSMFMISLPLTFFVFGMLALTGLIIGTAAKGLRKTSLREKEQMGLMLSVIEETISGLRIIFAFNAQKITDEKFRKVNDTYTRHMIKMYRLADLASPLSEFLGVAVFTTVLYFGGKLVLGEEPSMTGALFITYIAIFAQLIPPAKSLTTAYYTVQKGIASMERINKILDADISIREIEKPEPVLPFEKEIEYKSVSFAYRKTILPMQPAGVVAADSSRVLNDINLKIPRGKTIALVGQSGSGKSTLADLLPRFYDADKGEILIDGKNIRNMKIDGLRSLFGIVTQESILFNDTVFNNIAFGMKTVNEADVMVAARVANAHDFIMEMPEKYHTNIGDRGSKLSGGQRQRLSIARAVLKNPPILILDEATSALDTESERLVQDALNNLIKNRTSIVIAHRLSTIQNADEIVVIEKGKIAERGSHEELLNKNGSYKKLYDLQSFQ